MHERASERLEFMIHIHPHPHNSNGSRTASCGAAQWRDPALKAADRSLTIAPRTRRARSLSLALVLVSFSGSLSLSLSGPRPDCHAPAHWHCSGRQACAPAHVPTAIACFHISSSSSGPTIVCLCLEVKLAPGRRQRLRSAPSRHKQPDGHDQCGRRTIAAI